MPLLFGPPAVGQVLSVEPYALNSVGVALFGFLAQGDQVGALTLDRAVSIQLTSPDLIKSGRWAVVDTRAVEVTPSERPYERFRRRNWVGAKVVGSANIEALANTYFGHCPWEGSHGADYLRTLLLPKSP